MVVFFAESLAMENGLTRLERGSMNMPWKDGTDGTATTIVGGKKENRTTRVPSSGAQCAGRGVA
jgi:hypothetical protein